MKCDCCRRTIRKNETFVGINTEHIKDGNTLWDDPFVYGLCQKCYEKIQYMISKGAAKK